MNSGLIKGIGEIFEFVLNIVFLPEAVDGQLTTSSQILDHGEK